jgi:hypothetical protein
VRTTATTKQRLDMVMGLDQNRENFTMSFEISRHLVAIAKAIESGNGIDGNSGHAHERSMKIIITCAGVMDEFYNRLST